MDEPRVECNEGWKGSNAIKIIILYNAIRTFICNLKLLGFFEVGLSFFNPRND